MISTNEMSLFRSTSINGEEFSKTFKENNNAYPTYTPEVLYTKISIIKHLNSKLDNNEPLFGGTKVDAQYQIKKQEFEVLGHQFQIRGEQMDEMQYERNYFKDKYVNESIKNEKLKANEMEISEKYQSLKRKYADISKENESLKYGLKTAKNEFSQNSATDVRKIERDKASLEEQAHHLSSLSNELDRTEIIVERQAGIICDLAHDVERNEFKIEEQTQIIHHLTENLNSKEKKIQEQQKYIKELFNDLLKSRVENVENRFNAIMNG